MAQVTAVANGIRMSPRKISEVISLVRFRTVNDALVILEHTPRRAAEPVIKVITSAAANAVNNNKLSRDKLVIESIQVGPGQIMKRYRPTAMGRARPYMRRSSNIRVVVTEVTENGNQEPVNSKKSDPAQDKQQPSKPTSKQTAKRSTTTKEKK